MPSSPHDLFVAALAESGWTVTERLPVGSGPNPSQVQVRRGRLQRRLLVYAWRITSEGKGRKKAGREDLDYRIQTTRSHEGPLLTPAGHVSCGIGWDDERDVFASFDPWVKRYTGKSSSVHFPRTLLDDAATEGWSELDLPKYGPETSFRASEINRFLAWAVGLQRRRLVVLDPDEFHPAEERAEVIVDWWKEPLVSWLRPGDHLVLRRASELLDSSIWSIDGIEGEPQETPSGKYQRTLLRFRCTRYGVIRNPGWLRR